MIAPMNGSARVRVVVFYAAFLALLVLIVTKHLGDLLPHGLTNQIGHNSEGYAVAVVACAWVQWVLPESIRRAVSWQAALVGGVACLAVAIVFKTAGLPSTIGTLNEAFFGLAFVLPYVHIPGRVRWAGVFSIALVVALLIGHDTSVVQKGAEAWVVIVLAPLGLDVFDRGLLDPPARNGHLLRLAWLAALVVVPLLVALLDGHLGHGHVEGIRDYLAKANEAFVGLFIVHAYFGYWATEARPRIGPRAGGGLRHPA
jgi:hypothetical protein